MDKKLRKKAYKKRPDQEQDREPDNNTLYIYNPTDFPFGPLSNNYNQPEIINNKKWPTPTNFILSNMMIEPMSKLILQTSPILGNPKKTNYEDKVKQVIANTEAKIGKITYEELLKIKEKVKQELALQKLNIYELYNNLLSEEYFHTTRTAVEKAYTAKVAENPYLSELLLSTENRPIVYISNNTILGLGPDNHGYNAIGKTLEQIRHNIRLQIYLEKNKEKNEELEKKVLDIYKAYSILQYELHTKDNDLQEYIDKTLLEIIESFFENNPADIDTFFSKDIKDTVIQMYYKEQLAPLIKYELENPNTMVKNMIKENEKLLGKKKVDLRSEKILHTYNEYILKQKYPNMERENIKKASKQLLNSSPDIDSYMKVRNKVVELYNSGSLPQELLLKIKKTLSRLDGPIDVEDYEEDQSRKVSQEALDSVDESSSLDDDNPLKKLLGSDEKATKAYLIQSLVSYTGLNPKRYKKLSINDLKIKLARYMGPDASKIPEAGKWIARISTKAGKKTLKIFDGPSKPSSEDLDKLVKKYNKNHTVKISKEKISITWIPENTREILEDSIEDLEKKEEIKESLEPEGEPIEIHAVYDPKKPEEFSEFSPIFEKEFTIDKYKYPNVSLYITTMLLTQTGITKNINNQNIFTRGTSLEESRELLRGLNINQANAKYNEVKYTSFRELMKTLAKIVLEKKFSRDEYSKLLLLTGNKILVWKDPNDIFLGMKNEQGENTIGKILMEIREKIPKPEPEVNDLKEPSLDFDLEFYDNHVKINQEYQKNLVSLIEDYNTQIGQLKKTSKKYPERKKNLNLKIEEENKNLLELEKTIEEDKNKLKELIELKNNPIDLKISPKTLFLKVIKDKFTERWLIMRLNDMCSTVFKMKKYLSVVAKQEEDIKPEFVKKVLDIVYNPCNSIIEMSENIIVYPPNIFLVMVNRCEGTTIRLPRKYKEELLTLENELNEIEADFWHPTRKTVEKRVMDLSPEEFIEKSSQDHLKYLEEEERLNKELLEYINTNPSDDDLEKYKKEQKDRLSSFLKPPSKDDFDAIQYTEFKKFIKKLLKPKLSSKLIQKQMNDFNEKLSKNRILFKKELRKTVKNNEDFEKAEGKFLKEQQAEKDKLWKKLIEPEMSKEDINIETQKFNKKQLEESKIHYNNNLSEKTQEQMARFRELVQAKKSEISVLLQDYTEKVDKYKLMMSEVAQVYWNRLVSMLLFLSKHANSSGSGVPDVQKTIISLETLTSEKNNCQVPSKLKDEEENCIASALSNILASIEKFKHEYSEDTMPNIYDIDLASSIILNSPVEFQKKDKKNENKGPVPSLEPEFTDNMATGMDDLKDTNLPDDLGGIEEYTHMDPEEDKEDVDDMLKNYQEALGQVKEDREEDIQEREDYDDLDNLSRDSEAGSFGFSKDLEPIKIILREVYKKDLDNMDTLAHHFNRVIGFIKKSKLEKRIKNNRINFFATIGV